MWKVEDGGICRNSRIRRIRKNSGNGRNSESSGNGGYGLTTIPTPKTHSLALAAPSDCPLTLQWVPGKAHNGKGGLFSSGAGQV